MNDKVWERTTTRTTSPKKPVLEDTEDSSDEDDEDANIMLMPLTCDTNAEFECRNLTVTRTSIDEPWSFELFLAPNYESELCLLQIQLSGGSPPDETEGHEVMDVHCLNQSVVGSEGVRTLNEITELLGGTTALDLVVAKYSK